MADWSKKIENLIFYMKDGDLKNLPTLKANKRKWKGFAYLLKTKI